MMKSRNTSLVLKAVLVWLVMMAAESVHGTLRALFLVPRVGDLRARQIGVIVGALLVLGIAYVFSNWLAAAARKPLLLMGVAWTMLTVIFEVLFGHLVVGLSWQRLWSDYDIAHGGLMPFGLAAMTLSPLIASRLGTRRRVSATETEAQSEV
jgi:hypothetical protein